MSKPRNTSHHFGADMLCSACSAPFTRKDEPCEGATSIGRAEIRRRLEIERRCAIDRQALVTAQHFAELDRARRRR